MKKSAATIVLTLVLTGMAFGQNTAWDYDTKTNIQAQVTETARSNGLIVRCSKACEVYFIPDRYTLVEDRDSVLVKFNDKPVKRYGVSRSDSDTGLFFSDPMGILKAIRDNGGYMSIEYKPYQKIPDTVKYEVWNLPPTILTRVDKWENGLLQRKRQADLSALQEKRQANLSACSSEDECDKLRSEARLQNKKKDCEANGFVWHNASADNVGGCFVK